MPHLNTTSSLILGSSELVVTATSAPRFTRAPRPWTMQAPMVTHCHRAWALTRGLWSPTMGTKQLFQKQKIRAGALTGLSTPQSTQLEVPFEAGRRGRYRQLKQAAVWFADELRNPKCCGPHMVPHRGKLGRHQAHDMAALLVTFNNMAPFYPLVEPVCTHLLSAAE